jgi:hypothetical protein
MAGQRLIKISAVIMAVTIALVAGILIFVFTREGITVNSGSFSGKRPSNISGGVWKAELLTANGHSRVDYTFSADDLASMRVDSTNSAGRISLVITQGDVERTIDISGEYSGDIDMSAFKPGRLRLLLNYENAEEVDVVVSWTD